jgi:predicted nucleotidyltransferase
VRVLNRPKGKMMAKSTKLSPKKNSSQIRQIVQRVVKQFSPEQIILFGSYARGTARPNSDIDLLIVMPVKGSVRQKAIEIGVALHDIAIAKDLIVVTPQEFKWRKDVMGTIEWPAVRQGKVLYAKTG